MKKVWITALEHDQKQVQQILGEVTQYGLDGNGHFWTDDLKQMAWLEPKESLLDKDNVIWILLGTQKSLEIESVRYGLTLLTLTLQAAKGCGFPILLVDTKGDMNSESLPAPLMGIDVISSGSSSLGAKIVAKAHVPVKKIDTEYRIDVHANPHFGVWFEIGPSKESVWNGAMLGVCGGDIDAHGVGTAGRLPHKAVLEYQMRGLKLKLGEQEYSAWAVQNRIDRDHSYYIRVQGIPKSIVFGSYTTEDDAVMNVITF